MHVKRSFLVELRDKGKRGFLLPAEQIAPTGEELLEGLKVIANDIMAASSVR